METIILPSPTLHGEIQAIQPQEKSKTISAKRPRLASFSTTRDSSISWGRRHHHGSWAHSLGCLGIMVLCPCLVFFYWIALTSFRGSLTAPWQLMWESGAIKFFWTYAPRPTIKASIGYGAWLLFQAALYQFLPSALCTGQLTPAGNLLKYRTNGLLAWVVTHWLFVAASMYSVLDPAIIAKNWEGLLVIANMWGFALTMIAYVKAHLAPTHEGDRKFSGM